MYNNREYQKTYITGSASTSVFSGRGTLGGICINTTASGVITIYDGASVYASLKSNIVEGEYLQNIVISNGLTVSTSASPDITVKWTRG